MYPLPGYTSLPPDIRTSLATCCTCRARAADVLSRHRMPGPGIRTSESVILTSSLVRTPYQPGTGMAVPAIQTPNQGNPNKVRDEVIDRDEVRVRCPDTISSRSTE